MEVVWKDSLSDVSLGYGIEQGVVSGLCPRDQGYRSGSRSDCSGCSRVAELASDWTVAEERLHTVW